MLSNILSLGYFLVLFAEEISLRIYMHARYIYYFHWLRVNLNMFFHAILILSDIFLQKHYIQFFIVAFCIRFTVFALCLHVWNTPKGLVWVFNIFTKKGGDSNFSHKRGVFGKIGGVVLKKGSTSYSGFDRL